MTQNRLSDFEQHIGAFLESRRAKNVSAMTLLGYATTLARFRKWAEGQGIAGVRNVKPEHLRAWLVHLQTEHRDLRANGEGRPLTSESVLTYFVRVRTWIRWLRREEKIRTDPTLKVDRPKVERRLVESLRESDAQALLGLWTTRSNPYDDGKYLGQDRAKFLSARNRCILAMLLDTGARAGELLGANVEDIDPAERLIVVLGKGRKERSLPYSATASRLLQAYLKEREARFPDLPRNRGAMLLTTDGRPMTRQALRNIFARAKKALGVKGRLSPHILRHTAARLAVLGGADTLVLQRFLGHASPVVTSRYVSLFAGDLQREHRSWSPLERLLRGR